MGGSRGGFVQKASTQVCLAHHFHAAVPPQWRHAAGRLPRLSRVTAEAGGVGRDRWVVRQMVGGRVVAHKLGQE